MRDQKIREIPPMYTGMLPKWDRMAKRLMIAYTGCGAISIGCSLFVSTYTGHMNDEVIRFAALAGSAALAAISAFSLGSKANGVRNAWRLLNAACVRYQHDPGFTLEDLHAQYLSGEMLIGEISFNGSASANRP